MTKTISRIGNSQAITLDKAILDVVGLDVGSKVHIQTSGRSIVITPAEGTMPEDRFDESLRRVNKDYAELFKRLA